jgi:hypothetical protein
MRKWARASRRNKKLPRCTSCGTRISRAEPDVMLESLRVGGYLMFHEGCALDAYMAAVGGGPGAWRLTHRHVDERMN